MKEENQVRNQIGPFADISSVDERNSSLRVDLAIGTYSLYITVVLLSLLNVIIYNLYRPDIEKILAKVIPLSLIDGSNFVPEPVERMQFQISVIFAPIFMFLAFKFINRFKDVLTDDLQLAGSINVIGLGIFAAFSYFVFNSPLLYVTGTNTTFFHNNIIFKFNIVCGIFFYLMLSKNYYDYIVYKKSGLHAIIINIISYGLVAMIIVDMIFYNVFDLSSQVYQRTMETNAVFYSMTQVFAGKSLLVNINCQYGLYAWLLLPLFKITGLTIYKFSLTMGILNAMSFLLIFLGIKKVVRNDSLSLIVFLALVYWQYWNVRIPFGSTPGGYYQYWPIRMLFPSVAFFLISVFQAGSHRVRRLIAPLLSLCASTALFWNFDSGIAVFMAVLFSLLYSTFELQSLKELLTKAGGYLAWMCCGLVFMTFLFLVSTKLRSGSWPDFKHFLDFQNTFYISGFYMLPMSVIHFWNFTALTYFLAFIYCVTAFYKRKREVSPVLLFLFILGCGLFAYFQGRSYDTNLCVVIYPAIIILGIFCDKLLSQLVIHKFRFREVVVLFFITFLFLADGAFSMLNYIPSIHSFSMSNVFRVDTAKQDTTNKQYFTKRMNFLANNFPKRDSILIISKDYESYYYASGQYYNPVNIPGSTEVFFKSELFELLDVIKSGKYPVIFDFDHQWVNTDTILWALSKYYFFEKGLGNNDNFCLLKPLKNPAVHELIKDTSTVYFYNRIRDIGKRSVPAKITLHENFTIELLLKLDTTKLSGACWVFCNSSPTTPTSGIFMQQRTNDLTQYLFTYGNGKGWCDGVLCKLSCSRENYLLIQVRKNILTIFNNGVLCGTINTNSVISNSDGPLNFNINLAGVINSMKISNQ